MKHIKEFCSKYYPILILFAYFLICSGIIAYYYNLGMIG